MSIRTGVSTRAIVCILAILLLLSAASVAFVKNADAALLDTVSDIAGSIASPVRTLGTTTRTKQKKTLSDSAYGDAGDRIIVGQGNGLSYGSPARVDKVQIIEPSGTPRVLTGIEDSEPQWSADGTKVVFISMRDAPPNSNYFTRHDYRAIYVMNADGTDQRRLFIDSFSGPMQPTFSPDGNKVAYLNNGGSLQTVEVYGTGTQADVDISECTSSGARNTVRRRPGQELIPGVYGSQSPDYSPDGNYLIYTQWDSDLEVYAVFRVPTDGSGGCTMLYASNNDITPISPQYSPDGTKIAVYRVEDANNPATAVRKLWIIDAATGTPISEHIPPGFFGEAVWSPDGTKIAYPIGQYDEIADFEILGLGVRTYDLTTSIVENVDLTGFYEGINGLHWGVPTTVQPTLSMRINSPHPLASGSSTTGTLYLNAPAPAGGTTVTLSALGAIGAITVPPSVVIPEGQVSVDFPISSEVVALYRTAGILATRTSPTLAQAQASVSLHPARPDLLAVSFTAPATTTPGTSNAVSWTVQNIGPITTSGSGGYSNAVYFSTDTVLGAEDIQVSVLTGTTLAAGATQTQNTTATIPGNRVPSTGQYYLIFAANNGNSLNEGGQLSNNQIVHPIQVNTPDLVVENLVVPAQVEPGTAYSLTFNIRNAGVVATTGTFATQIFFSEDNVAGNADDAQLLSFNISTSLAVGGVSPQTRSVTIPPLPARNSGPAFYYVKVDSGNSIPEGTSTGEVNNNTFQATEFRYRLPDLIVENLTVPALVETGTQYPLTFNIRNAGEVATSGTFATQLYFSEDNVAGNADDAQLLSFNISTPIAVGGTSPQTRNVTIPNLPVRNNGPAFFYVKVDSGNTVTEGVTVGENNNILFQGTQFEYRVADLQVTASSVASDVDTDTVFPLAWTTANTGNKATTANFVDRVYLSADQTVGGGDTTLGSFTLTGGLAAGATADRVQNITINYANVPASGTYYLLIQADQSNIVNEGANEGNNVRVQPVYVRKALRPDLVVTNVTGPPTVFFDQTIQVQWTVTNNGTGPTNAPQWKDRLHIGTSPTSTSGASLLAESNSITALNPGESYTTSATVRIPRGISGAYRFIVTANSNGAVNEVSTTNNLLSSAVTVNVPPLPDLVVQSVSAPDVVFAGTPVSISYTIGNVGTAEAGYRKERIYLSRNTVLNTGEDKLIFTSDGTYGPAAGQSQTHTSRNRVGNQEPAVYQDVFLPSNLEGLWYVFVVTDYRNDTYEYSAENNNTGYDIAEPGSPMNILVTPPDLTVPNQPTAPTTIATGQSFNVDFMVRNQGAFNASPFLYHGIYLSADQTFSPGTDNLLGTFRDPVFFGPGDEHPISISTSLQACLPNGTYYLFAVADYNNHQFEFDPGYDAEANNASPFREIQVFTVPPDLQVTALSHSAVSMPGDNVTVNWTVANTGGTASGNWIDRVYLVSPDPQIGTLTLAAVQRTGGLPSGGSYSESRTVSLPAFMQGTYYFAVGTDTGTSVPECGTAENNNGAQGSNFNVTNNLPDLVVNSVTAPSSATVGDTFQVQWTGRNANQQMPANSSSWRDSVYLSSDTSLSNSDIYLGSALNTSILGANQTYLQQTNVTIGNVAPGTYYVLVYGDANRNIYEGTNASGFESNNVTASAPITLSVPAVDLTVGGVTLSTPHYSGTYRNVSWTVTNNGSTPTLTDAWTDYIYLSRDSILDPSDTQLGYRGRSGVLAGGANYVQTSSVFIPVGLTGAYTIFVVTDRNNSVVENNNSNNTSLPLSISLSVPPPAEMSITNIVPPASMSVGGNATFTWTVQNTGANPVEGQWRDTVYLSRDQFWDASDTLVGIRDLNSQTTPLPASGTYTTSYGGAVPPIEEGTYYVIVRTDAQNRIREANEVNNVATSVGTTTITIQTLTLGTPFNTTLGNGAQMFFKYATTPAETLVFSLDTDINSRSNEVFTNFDTMVSRADYDFQSTRPGAGDQENFIPATQAGDYYSMVRTDYIPEFFAENFDKSPKKSNNNLGTSVPDQNITVEAEILPFSIRSIEPETGGNSGYTTLLIKGAKFEQGANVKLVGPKGIEILPVMNRVATSKIAALFDLKSKSPGIYDVIVTNPGGATTQLADSFTITTGGGHQLSEFTQGPRFYRAGLGGRFRYTLSARNDGGNDAINVPFIIDIPQVNYELDRSNILDLPASALPPGIPLPLPTHYDIGDRRVIILLIPILRARTSANFRINLNIPTSLNSYSINSVTLPPLAEIFEAGFTQSDGQQNALALARLLKQRAPQAGIDNGCWAEFMRQLGFLILGQLLKRLDAVGDCGRFIAGLIAGVSDTISGGLLSYATGSQTDATGAAFTMSGVIGNFLSRIAGSGLDCAKNVIDTTIPPLEAFFLTISVGQLLYQLYQCIQPIGDEYEAFGLGSFDPNEKIGPAGYGGERFVPDRTPMLYRINFENLASATAPAQRIFVTDQLPLTLDPRTVRIKEIGFKQQQIIVPDNQASYQARLQLGEDLNNLQVDVLAGLDLVNRRVFWSLQAIDPATGEEPLDPTLGLLPPNNSNRDGEGYVTFTIEPTAAQPTRTDLVNNATIVFDTNEAIITNTVSNLLDSGIPTSQLAPLPPTSTVPIFDLSWAGTDDATGSGLKGIDVLYSDDGSTYSPFVLNSQANNIEFAGKWGKLYRFHTRARDNAGNIEAAPIIPDATIQVFGGDTESDVAPRPNGSDGSLNADDLAQVRRFVAGLDTDFLYNELQRADSSPRNDGGDGALTVSDVMQARRFAAGLDPTPEALGPNEPASFSPKTINGRSAGLLPREVKPITIVRHGNQIEVGIVLETQGDETALGFGLNFDPAVLSNPVATLRPIASGGTLTVNTAQVATGKLGIMLDKAPNQPFVAGSNVLMTIMFNIANGSPATTQITFGDDPIKREVVDGPANGLTTTFSPGTIQLLGPTSANVSISGRVLKADGTPIKGAKIVLSGNQTSRNTALSNPFGYFTFNDVASGQTYTISTTARGYTFTPRSIMVTDEISGLEITPDP